MKQNQKIIGGAIALGVLYLLFKDKIKEVITLSPPKGNNSYSAPKQSQATTISIKTNSKCPKGQKELETQCIKAPCQSFCVPA